MKGMQGIRLAKRISGQVSVRLSFSDANSCYLCTVSAPEERTRTIRVNPAKIMAISVDCPEAYDSAARAAIAFAGFMGHADVDFNGTAVLSRKR